MVYRGIVATRGRGFPICDTKAPRVFYGDEDSDDPARGKPRRKGKAGLSQTKSPSTTKKRARSTAAAAAGCPAGSIGAAPSTAASLAPPDKADTPRDGQRPDIDRGDKGTAGLALAPGAGVAASSYAHQRRHEEATPSAASRLVDAANACESRPPPSSISSTTSSIEGPSVAAGKRDKSVPVATTATAAGRGGKVALPRKENVRAKRVELPIAPPGSAKVARDVTGSKGITGKDANIAVDLHGKAVGGKEAGSGDGRDEKKSCSKGEDKGREKISKKKRARPPSAVGTPERGGGAAVEASPRSNASDMYAHRGTHVRDDQGYGGESRRGEGSEAKRRKKTVEARKRKDKKSKSAEISPVRKLSMSARENKNRKQLPHDLTEKEIRTSGHVEISVSVLDRAGFCKIYALLVAICVFAIFFCFVLEIPRRRRTMCRKVACSFIYLFFSFFPCSACCNRNSSCHRNGLSS